MPSVPSNSIGIKAAWIPNNRSYSNPTVKTKKKLMLHSTATPGAVAATFAKNWNSASANCSTEFVLDDKEILQMMPIGTGNGANCWKSWHAGASANNTHVACEVCEPLQTQLIPINFQTQGRNAKYPRTYSTTRIQMELKALGYYKDEVDGKFGPNTEIAVKAYQKDNGLTQDGQVGKATLKKMQARKGSYAAYDVVEATPFFNAAYDNAVKLYGFLCNYLGAKPSEIVCHSEGYTSGIASNHADVMHWFPYHGKSMDTFRADVAKWIAGNYVPLTLAGATTAPEDEYVNSVNAMVKAGIINTPDYWTGLLTADDVKNNYVMALLRQTGAYFCKKSHVYAVDAITTVCGIQYPDNWKNNKTYTTEGVKALYIAIAKAISGRNLPYDAAINLCFSEGIINTPEYWLNLKTETVPNTNCVYALLRQAGAYFCGKSYVYAVDGIEKAINMNSAGYWRAGSYNIMNVKFLINAVAKAL